MAYISEIDKLEQRYRENPKGRNFAPLADAYRKAGLLDNAIELCTSGLERHPDYVSAYIVYGRCLIDQKNEAAAADVFRKVITLDPENVLGLRMLSEIAERANRFDEAVEWLTRLLGADPMNGDAAEALSRAKSKAAQATAGAAEAVVQKLEPTPKAPPPHPAPPPPARPPSASPAARPYAGAAATAVIQTPELVVEHPSEQPVAPGLTPAKPPAGDIETFDGALDFNAAAHQMAKAEGLEVQEDVELTSQDQDLVVEGLAHTQYESAFGPPAEPELGLPAVELPLIMPEDVAETTLPAPMAPAAGPAPAALRAPTVAGPGASAGASSAPPAAVALSDDDGAADTAALSRAEPVLTETMAELYLKQGHPEDALRVYHALLVQRPHDARLRTRVDALTHWGKREAGEPAGESLPAFLKRILSARSPAPEPPPVAASPLDRAFAVAALEHESQPEIDAPGEATRPAEDTISLDQVFGDEGGTGGARGSYSAVEPGSPPPPPLPQPPPAPSPTAASEPTPGGFSFDQFFGAPAVLPAAPADAPAAPRVSGPKARPPLEDVGDLDQFQAWLKGLKS